MRIMTFGQAQKLQRKLRHELLDYSKHGRCCETNTAARFRLLDIACLLSEQSPYSFSSDKTFGQSGALYYLSKAKRAVSRHDYSETMSEIENVVHFCPFLQKNIYYAILEIISEME